MWCHMVNEVGSPDVYLVVSSEKTTNKTQHPEPRGAFVHRDPNPGESQNFNVG